MSAIDEGEYRLARRTRLTPGAARRLVMHLALHSNDSPNGRYRSEAQLATFLSANGLSLEAIVEEAREFSKPVPNFENLVGSTWRSSAGGTQSVIDIETEGEYATVRGPGTLAMSTYWQDAELAWEALERAVERCSFGDLLTALTLGVASVENYVNYRAQRWNFSHAQQVLEDSKAKKVSFESKVEDWIPVMTGKALDRSGREWSGPRPNAWCMRTTARSSERAL